MFKISQLTRRKQLPCAVILWIRSAATAGRESDRSHLGPPEAKAGAIGCMTSRPSRTNASLRMPRRKRRPATPAIFSEVIIKEKPPKSPSGPAAVLQADMKPTAELLAQALAHRQDRSLFNIVFDSNGKPIAWRDELLIQKPKGSA
jgi:hypothetical protein